MFISFVLPLHFIVPLFWLTFSSHFIKSQAWKILLLLFLFFWIS
jgi:hypothetical protein